MKSRHTRRFSIAALVTLAAIGLCPREATALDAAANLDAASNDSTVETSLIFERDTGDAAADGAYSVLAGGPCGVRPGAPAGRVPAISVVCFVALLWTRRRMPQLRSDAHCG